METKVMCIAIFVSVISFLYIYPEQDPVIIIGILSAQNNTEARKAIRETWINIIRHDPRLKHFFIIGDICPVHPLDRVDQWSCKLWEVAVPEESHLPTGKQRTCTHISPDFYFCARVSVIITAVQFSCPQQLFWSQDNNTLCRFEILDALTDQTLSSATIQHFEGRQRFQRPLFLPAGYEARVHVYATTMNSNVVHSEIPITTAQGYSWDGAGGLLTLLEIDDVLDCVAATLIVTPGDLSFLKKHNAEISERQTEHSHNMRALKKQLALEYDHHKDMAFVPIIDSYRNLTSKLLAFLEWIQMHERSQFPKFLLKTDDDVFVDASLVVQNLESYTERVNVWWGTFRKGWPLQRAGKWRESSPYYNGIYPTFPCGAGYVLSWDLVTRLLEESKRKGVWKPQGEDVSVGAWLKGVAPKELRGSCFWDCPPSNTTTMPRPLCNLGEQTPKSMRELWQQYLLLGHIP